MTPPPPLVPELTSLLSASLRSLTPFCPRAFAGVPAAWGDPPHVPSIPPCHSCSPQSGPGDCPDLHSCRLYSTHLGCLHPPGVKAIQDLPHPRKLPTISTGARTTLAYPVPQNQQRSKNTWEETWPSHWLPMLSVEENTLLRFPSAPSVPCTRQSQEQATLQ